MRTFPGIVVLVAVAACTGNDKAGRQPLGNAPASAVSAAAPLAASGVPMPAGPPLSPAAKLSLDAGNAAYRAKRYDEAIARYREAALASPDHAAPWFGLYMVATLTKNKPLADSAMLKVNLLSSDAPALNSHAEVAAPPKGRP